MYSIRRYKGVYIASQVCENTIFIPQTLEEFRHLLFHDCVLEMLFSLKVEVELRLKKNYGYSNTSALI